MCYPKPGPRCAAHAKAAFVAADMKVHAASVRVHAAKERVTAGDESARAELNTAVGEWEKAGFERLHARDNYDATPEGMSTLQGLIDKTSDSMTRIGLQARLASAEARREHQLELLRAMQSSGQSS